MAFENLFIRIKRSIGGIQLDGVINETHNKSVRITKNPVESGVSVADHAVLNPTELSMKAIVTDSPLGTAAFTQIVDSVTGLFGSSTTANSTRSQQAYSAIVALMENREPISVTTRLAIYDDVLISSVFVDQDKSTSQAIHMDIKLEQVIITESKVVSNPESNLGSGSTKKQASSATEEGRKEAITPDRESSVLNSMINFFG